MANSRFEYVRNFELPDQVLLNTWIVVRVDGRGFHKYVMRINIIECAKAVMQEFGDIFLAYGQSDEYSLVFTKTTNVYNRRSTKLASTVGSLFTSAFVFHWPEYFKSTPLTYPPSFDARVVSYPSIKVLYKVSYNPPPPVHLHILRSQNMRDYLSWRHVDCHINNLYNTCFWSLVHTGESTPQDAEALLRHTDAKAKHELLFSQFQVNYNDISPMFKRGSTLFRTPDKSIAIAHVDLIKDETFWITHIPLLTPRQDDH
ncbi:hypothetical protein B5M09_010444 [Aphanomyces astaci]|uniref:tRNA(His) guanylyltransferase n=1 Tax=Aphanomyces astaci TaxID=112090 RepID=A0A425CUI8_APHAT|nr:hypothetical protein B5M09_010444 [Aphanomyces astaci]